MDFFEALSEARKHSSIVQRMEFDLKSDPLNPELDFGLGSARRRAKRSEILVESFAATSQRDLVRYRLLNETDQYAVEAVSESVGYFQKSFTGAADFLENGPKEQARYSEQIRDLSQLNFGYSFAGSLGIVLSVPNRRDLFGEGQLDKVVDVFAQFLDVNDENAAVDASRSLGPALISQLCRWVEVNAKWENAVDFVVKQPSGIQRGQFVSKNRFFDLAGIFDSAQDIEPHRIKVSGVLVGIDVTLKKFHLTVPDGESFKGNFSDEFVLVPTFVVGESFEAIIDERIVRKVSTGNETRSYSIVSLIPRAR